MKTAVGKQPILHGPANRDMGNAMPGAAMCISSTRYMRAYWIHCKLRQGLPFHCTTLVKKSAFCVGSSVRCVHQNIASSDRRLSWYATLELSVSVAHRSNCGIRSYLGLMGPIPAVMIGSELWYSSQCCNTSAALGPW